MNMITQEIQETETLDKEGKDHHLDLGDHLHQEDSEEAHHQDISEEDTVDHLHNTNEVTSAIGIMATSKCQRDQATTLEIVSSAWTRSETSLWRRSETSRRSEK